MCVRVWSCITCKCSDECRMRLLRGLKKVFSVPHSGFSSVPKHNVMEHDSSLVPWWPLTPITVVWDPTLPYPTPTDLHTRTHTHTHLSTLFQQIRGDCRKTLSDVQLVCTAERVRDDQGEKFPLPVRPSAPVSLSLSFLTDEKKLCRLRKKSVIRFKSLILIVFSSVSTI